jgi:hypothetical protein
MPEVTPTGSTDDLSAFDPKRKVHMTRYRARDGWMETDQSSQVNTARHIRR